MTFRAFRNNPIISRTTGGTASSSAIDLDDNVDSLKHKLKSPSEQKREARNATRQALVSKRSTSEDLVNERNTAAMSDES